MTTLSIWRYETVDGAEGALRILERLQHRGRIAIDDAALVAWDVAERRPRTYQTGTVDGTAALSGAFWGLLFALALLLPEPGTSAPDVGLSDGLLRRLRARIGPGTSALFVLTDHDATDRLRVALADHDVELFVHRLDPAQQTALRSAFAG
ncbi:DUF1269 domain-containing protein [Actinomycetospora sp. OC33-EN08]|uniref:DUF1269 domain-containing protein n=1 Tax=Actinomycetospora aurantiaca TaxID=3129233 RepID=A0ABU8MMY6_9PSEU